MATSSCHFYFYTPFTDQAVKTKTERQKLEVNLKKTPLTPNKSKHAWPKFIISEGLQKQTTETENTAPVHDTTAFVQLMK